MAENNNLQRLLGVDQLLTKKGLVPTAEILANKNYIMIYFSAHWCPPCRAFTPELVKWYANFSPQHQDVELLYASSDETADQFASYHAEMPWPALPFENRREKAALSKHFGVTGIPTLVVIDAAGNLVTKNARGEVSSDPAGDRFPWRPKTVAEILASAPLLNNENKSIKLEDVSAAADYVAFYFSAHWCPPCRAFTPTLIDAYNQVRKQGQKLEVVFVSLDRDQGEYEEYFGTMPWLSIGFNDPRRSELEVAFEINGIPHLTVCDAKDFSIINPNARGALSEDPMDCPWKPKPLAALAKLRPSDNVIEALNERTIVLLNTVAITDQKMGESIMAVVQTVAAQYAENVNPTATIPVQFLFNQDASSDLLNRIASVVEVDPQSALFAFNLPKDKKKAVFGGNPTNADEVKKFVDDFSASL